VSNVTFVIQHLLNGGAEKQLLLSATALALHGFQCQVLPLSPIPPHPRLEHLVRRARSAGVEIRAGDTSCLGKLLRPVAVYTALAKARPGVIWSWGLRADLLCKATMVFNKEARLVCSLRSAYRDRMIRDARWIRFRNQAVVRYVSNSWSNCELLDLIIPGALHRCSVLYNSLGESEVDAPQVELPATIKTLRVVMLGNLRLSLKGYDTALEAIARYRSAGLPVELHVAGRGDDLGIFLHHQSRLGLDSVIHYHGEVSQPDAFLRQGHVFLLASRVEGMPNALLEAMNLGLPCVATRVGDVGRFATDPEHLRIVPVNDPDAIVGALRWVASHWEAAKSMGMRARALCQSSFIPSHLGTEAVKLIRSVVASP